MSFFRPKRISHRTTHKASTGDNDSDNSYVKDEFRALISALKSRQQPMPGWEAKVWASLEQHPKKSTPNFWGLSKRTFSFLCCSSAAAIFVGWIHWSPPTGDIDLSIQFQHHTPRRGANVHPGDSISFEASTGNYSNAELRLYWQDEKLVGSCSMDACQKNNESLFLEQKLRLRGQYQAVLIVSQRAIPNATGRIDEDFVVAQSQDAKFILGDSFFVW